MLCRLILAQSLLSRSSAEALPRLSFPGWTRQSLGSVWRQGAPGQGEQQTPLRRAATPGARPSRRHESCTEGIAGRRETRERFVDVGLAAGCRGGHDVPVHKTLTCLTALLLSWKRAAASGPPSPLAGGIDHTLPSGGSSRTPAPDRGAGPGPAPRKAPAISGLPAGDLPAPRHPLPGSLATWLWLWSRRVGHGPVSLLLV
ncbi:uncharacterized protein LOC128151962 [Harpia harpyja]|uniref:uncharacterized protein LOC128151962 n=1 Tax=Harpia harpyja TaxID=202280 RepID=UPI0022B088B3|nr:uncharacterized protein LOC128151962 [Harpia harpyja]